MFKLVKLPKLVGKAAVVLEFCKAILVKFPNVPAKVIAPVMLLAEV